MFLPFPLRFQIETSNNQAFSSFLASEPVFLSPNPDRMRIPLLFLVMISFFSLGAKAQLPLSGMSYSQRNAFPAYNSFIDSNKVNKKWSIHKYGGISASYVFFNSGSASVFSSPVGLQLNRRLNNNLYAFAGISVAPAYINFNRTFINPDANKYHPVNSRYNNNGFSMYSRFEAGLMYMNEEKTFSISGSIGIERSSYPIYPSYNNPYLQKQQTFSGSRQ